MQVFVRSLAGETLSLQAPSAATVLDLKTQLQQLTGVEASAQRLTFGCLALDDELTLVEAGVEEEATLFQSLALLGAGKKRKKKTYTKPKKQKHKKHKVKLPVLKFYKVDESAGKVQRLRNDCPSKTCGAGVFMAKHKDRTYCGRCGLTYMLK